MTPWHRRSAEAHANPTNMKPTTHEVLAPSTLASEVPVLPLGQEPSAIDTTATGVATANYLLDLAHPLPVEQFPNPPDKDGGSPISTIPNVQHLVHGYGITA